MNDKPIIFCAEFPGSKIIESICEDNGIPFFTPHQELSDSDDSLKGRTVHAFGFLFNQMWPYENNSYFPTSPSSIIDIADHMKYSLIGRFFSLFEITDQADSAVFSASVSELAPGRGYTDKIKGLSRSAYKVWRANYIWGDAQMEAEEIEERMILDQKKLSALMITDGICDHRDEEPDKRFIEACYMKGCACLYMDGDKLMLDGPCGDSGYDWFKDVCESCGYEILVLNKSRQYASAIVA